MKLKIGSRDSLLAVAQSQIAMRALLQAEPGLTLELVTMKTTGDRILDRSLDEVGGKGLFVKELDRALLDGEVDLTVHSLKDMPMETDPRIPIAAFSRREDARDVLVLPAGGSGCEPGHIIGCSSLRRKLQLQALYPEADIRPVRGNIQTRLRKLDAGEFDSLVLAAAGLRRLGLAGRIARTFSPDEVLPASGQGILAAQARADFDRTLLRCFHDEDAAACALAERAFVRTLGGGCSSPVAAYAEAHGAVLQLTGLYVNPDGSYFRDHCEGGTAAAAALGAALALRMRKEAGT